MFMRRVRSVFPNGKISGKIPLCLIYEIPFPPVIWEEGKMKRIFLSYVLCGLTVGTGLAGAAQEWPQWGQNAQHTGTSSAIGQSPNNILAEVTIFKLNKSDGSLVARINPFSSIDVDTFTGGPLTADSSGNIYYNAMKLVHGSAWHADVVGSWLVKVSANGTIQKATYTSLT